MILWLLACFGTAEDPLSDEALLALYIQQPEAAVERLMAVEDPIVRMGVLEALLLSHPEIAPELCPLLPEGPEAIRCSRIVRRPHLWTPRQPARPKQRPAPGPARTRVLPEVLDAPYASVVPQPPPSCDSGPDPIGCRMHKAKEAAQRRDTALAAGICQSAQPERWRQECFFEAAEQRLRRDNPGGYSDAVDLCASSGSFASDCLLHLHWVLTPRVPPSTAPKPAWRPVLRSVQVVEARWAAEPIFAGWAADRVWAGVAMHAVMQAREVTGDLLDHLPAAAAPHIRSAVAMRLVEDAEPAPRLSDLQTRLTAALARRVEAPMRRGQPVKPSGYFDLWPEDGPGEETLPALPYLGASRRVTSADPEVDGVLALLEAAARQDPPKSTVLADGAAHEAEIVRRTAARLQEKIDIPPGK
ncbi:MAG: hypothetical protein AAFV53_19010 [Myxococcota bacterium]